MKTLAQVLTLDQPQPKFEQFCLLFESLTDSTRQTYFFVLRHLSDYYKVHHSLRSIFHIIEQFPDQLTAEIALRNFQIQLSLRLSPASIHTVLSAISWCFRSCKRVGLHSWTPILPRIDIIPYRDTSGPPPIIIRDMINLATSRDDSIGIRDVAILTLLFTSGIRRSELVSLRVSDFIPVPGHIFITAKRRSQPVKISISVHTVDRILEWQSVRPGSTSGYLFIRMDQAVSSLPYNIRLSVHGVYKLVRRYSEAAGWRISPHQIRHSAITATLNHTNDLRAACRFSRHRSLATLQLYDDNRKDSVRAVSTYLSDLLLKGVPNGK